MLELECRQQQERPMRLVIVRIALHVYTCTERFPCIQELSFFLNPEHEERIPCTRIDMHVVSPEVASKGMLRAMQHKGLTNSP